jgi:undecaprenyl diphosphate synthase
MNTRIAIGVFCILLLCCFYWYKFNQNDFYENNESHKTSVDIPATQEIQEDQPLQHLACIMDGNRRWAKEHGLSSVEGHKEGINKSKLIIEFCLEKKIPYLSLYIFSNENFKRSAQELKSIFELMLLEAKNGCEEFKKQDIRIRFIGDHNLFPEQLRPYLDQFEKETAHCKTLQATFLFCYGGRQEIASAAKTIAHKVKIGELAEDEITPEIFAQYLWTRELPEPDLIIRTGFVSRLSNFLLYQAAYAELYMLDCYWPDITKEKLQRVYDHYMNCERRFGA